MSAASGRQEHLGGSAPVSTVSPAGGDSGHGAALSNHRVNLTTSHGAPPAGNRTSTNAAPSSAVPTSALSSSSSSSAAKQPTKFSSSSNNPADDASLSNACEFFPLCCVNEKGTLNFRPRIVGTGSRRTM